MRRAAAHTSSTHAASESHPSLANACPTSVSCVWSMRLHTRSALLLLVIVLASTGVKAAMALRTVSTGVDRAGVPEVSGLSGPAVRRGGVSSTWASSAMTGLSGHGASDPVGRAREGLRRGRRGVGRGRPMIGWGHFSVTMQTGLHLYGKPHTNRGLYGVSHTGKRVSARKSGW